LRHGLAAAFGMLAMAGAAAHSFFGGRSAACYFLQ